MLLNLIPVSISLDPYAASRQSSGNALSSVRMRETAPVPGTD
jgi:hypothetical protein